MEEFDDQRREVHVIAADEDSSICTEGERFDQRNEAVLDFCCCRFSTFADPTLDSLEREANSEVSPGNTSSVTEPKGRLFLSSAELASFAEASRLTRTLGASVIKREAAIVNRRLLSVQKRTAAADENHANKRPKLDKEALAQAQSDSAQVSPSQISSSHEGHKAGDDTLAASISYEEQVSIWDQVNRMKRMSMYLKNAQLAQHLLLQEMKVCRAEAIKEAQSAAEEP
jgi:hypothetical protein